MTILTMPVQPGRDTGAAQGSVPWRGMLWVTWRQHRGVLISVLAMGVGFARTVAGAGRADRVIIVSTGAVNEAISSIAREAVTRMGRDRGARRSRDAPHRR